MLVPPRRRFGASEALSRDACVVQRSRGGSCAGWFARTVLLVLGLLAWGGLYAPSAMALIHSAPIIVKGQSIKVATHYPLGMYRLFRTDPATGQAVVIPFQIDEINEWGDYVLPLGGDVTARTGTGIFDLQDELTFMGEDVGPVKAPTHWDGMTKPAIVFEVKLTFKGTTPPGDKDGAVYLGVYFQGAPPLSKRNYVTFDRASAEVLTSRYRYAFDQKNWLVSRHVDMVKRSEGAGKAEFIPLLDSTTFFMRADLKYFLTVEASHRSIDSLLEAYKIGPIRSIIRISFHYTFLKLNFELGMYTEVSFFSNAVNLPAVLYNPLDGKKSLNDGSGFYYGMAMHDSPMAFKMESNMPPYKKSGMFDFLNGKPSEPLYWITASGPDRMLYMEISPSEEMRKHGSVPLLYQEDLPSSKVLARGAEMPGELGQSPVNMALYFDMTKFTEGEHTMAFRLFFENTNDEKRLAAFKSLNNWSIDAARLR